MVLISIVTGAYKPTYNWGASHCTTIVHGGYFMVYKPTFTSLGSPSRRVNFGYPWMAELWRRTFQVELLQLVQGGAPQL